MTFEQHPKGWVARQLKDVAEIQRKSVAADKIKSGTQYVGLEHIDSSGSFTRLQRVLGGELASTKFIFGPEHLLYGKLRPYLKKIARPHFSGVCSTDILPIFPNKEVLDRNFLYHYLRQTPLVNLAAARSIGANLPRLSPKTLGEFPVFLPSLSEQKRIAVILDKADAIRRKRQEAIALADTFLRSVFLKMFGDPVTNPMGWDEVPLKNVSSIGSGVTKGKKYKELQLVEVPYMRVANVQDGWIDTTDIKTIFVSPTDVARFSMKKGDLLLTEGGDPDKLGRGAVWDGSISPCIHQNHIFKVRFDTSVVLPEFASFLIGSIRGKRYFLCAAKQTTGIATINKTQLSNFMMLVPNIKLQRQFAGTVLRAKATWKKLEQLAGVSNDVFFSLQQRAFRGDL